MIKNLYALNNQTKYVEALNINGYKNEKNKFEVHFTFELVSNIKYTMSKMFEIIV